MAKIILTKDGTVLQERILSKERITIGRHPHNDIVLDNLAVSAEHAVIVTILDDAYLEDLNSTNGTQIHGQPVRKHFLQDNDVVELAHYRIRYVTDDNLDNGAEGPLHASDSRDGSAFEHQRHGDPTKADPRKRRAVVKVLNGASAGKEVALTKVLTTIGRPGVQVAVITRGPHGYSITHVEGDAYPLVNGQSIGAGAFSMADGDVIDLSGTRMAFLIT